MPNGVIPRERIALIVNRVLPEFGTDTVGGDIECGRLEAMASTISDATGFTKSAMLKRLYVIRTGNAGISRCTGLPEQGDLTFNTADSILSGLGLTHLWHTELADLYEAA